MRLSLPPSICPSPFVLCVSLSVCPLLLYLFLFFTSVFGFQCLISPCLPLVSLCDSINLHSKLPPSTISQVIFLVPLSPYLAILQVETCMHGTYVPNSLFTLFLGVLFQVLVFFLSFWGCRFFWLSLFLFACGWLICCTFLVVCCFATNLLFVSLCCLSSLICNLYILLFCFARVENFLQVWFTVNPSQVCD